MASLDVDDRRKCLHSGVATSRAADSARVSLAPGQLMGFAVDDPGARGSEYENENVNDEVP